MRVLASIFAISLFALSTSAAFAAMSVSDGFEAGSRVRATGSGALSSLAGQSRTGKGYGMFRPAGGKGSLGVTSALGRKPGSVCTATLWVFPVGGGALDFSAIGARGARLGGTAIPVLVSGGDVKNNFYQPYTFTFRASGKPVTIAVSYDPMNLAPSLRIDDLSVQCR